MDTNALFTMALGLKSPWEVRTLDFNADERRLDILVDFERGASFPCPTCGQPAKVHDTEEKTWRHLDFFQHAAYLTARVPRCKCDEHGVKQVAVPWAREGSGFTLLFEALVMTLVQGMPVAAAARLVGEHDTRIWRILHHHVDEARSQKDMSGVTQLGMDETASRRGQNYITLFMDMAARSLLFATEGRDAATVAAFKADLLAHGGKVENIEEACMDMHQAFIKGVQAAFPNAHLTFDRFHVMKMANEAVDQVRRQEAKDHPELKRTRYCWLKNPSNLTSHQRERIQDLKCSNLQTAEAYRMKLTLQDFYEQSNLLAAGQFLEEWCEMATESGLHLGMTATEVEAVLGKPQHIQKGLQGTMWFYAASVGVAMSREEAARRGFPGVEHVPVPGTSYSPTPGFDKVIVLWLREGRVSAWRVWLDWGL